MARPSIGDMERSMAALTIGVVKGVDERKRQNQLEGLAEAEEHVVVEVSGLAGEFATWQETEIEFTTLFVDATDQRSSPFDFPLFVFGAYVSEGGPVGLDACVTAWRKNRRNQYTGCRLAVGVRSSDFDRKFRGQVHAIFSGYGAPNDEYGDLEALDVG